MFPPLTLSLGEFDLNGLLIGRHGRYPRRRRIRRRQNASQERKLYSCGSNEPLTTAGEFESELCYKDKRFSECFIVVEDKTRAILSKETTEELAIVKLEMNTLKEKSSLRDFPSVLME